VRLPASATAGSKAVEPAPAPQLGLCLWDQVSLQPASHVMTAASGGLELSTGTSLAQVLSAISPPRLKLLVIDHDLALPGSLEALASVCPDTLVVLVCEVVDQAVLELAQRLPGIIGMVARHAGRVRTWELGYLVRRTLVPEQEAPGSDELLSWGASTRVFVKGDTKRNDMIVRAVDMVAGWHGLSDQACEIVASAANELFTQLTVDPGFQQVPDELIPTLRITIDPAFVALDLFDPFLQITRPQLFRALLQGKHGPSATTSDHDVALSELFRTSSILRIDSVPGRETRVSWILDRGAQARRSQGRSVYLVEGR
jgi:hypothetical protein